MSHRGSILALPSGIRAWTVDAVAEIDARQPSRRLRARPRRSNFLLLGTGADVAPLPGRRALALPRRRHRRRRRWRRGAAARTYNILLAENRKVARGADRRAVSGHDAPSRDLAFAYRALRATSSRDGTIPTATARRCSRRRSAAATCIALYAFNSRDRARARRGPRADGRRDPPAMVARRARRARRAATCGRTRWRPRSTTRSSGSGCRAQALVDLIDARDLRSLRRPDADPDDLEGYCGETSSSLIRLAALILADGGEPGGAGRRRPCRASPTR